MSKYFIETSDGVIYSLDATSRINKRLTGKVTDNVVESGVTLADNYVNMPDTFSLSGVITDIKTPTSFTSLDTYDWINGLTKLKESGTPFILRFGYKIPQAETCVFTSINIQQTSTNGSYRTLDSFSINLDIKKIRLATQVQIEAVKDASVLDQTRQKQLGQSSTRDVEDTTTFADGVKDIKAGFN